jgi:NADP-dependent 3-hydroxy acid dehydrogenase YdfG
MNVLITGLFNGHRPRHRPALVRAGFHVWATARRVETLDELAAAGCHVLALDVTSEASMEAAIAGLEIDVLINNAGYSQPGALETLPMESVRRQFETQRLRCAVPDPARAAGRAPAAAAGS